MSNCPNCGVSLSDGSSEPIPSACPNCGRSTRGEVSPLERGLDPIRRYFHDLWQVITRPTLFFRRMPVSGGVSGPLAFALITHWLGSAMEYLWKLGIGGVASEYLGSLFRMATDVAEVDSPGRTARLMEVRDQVLHWIWGAGSVIADPFLTMVSILFTTMFVFVGARILVTPGKQGASQEVTFESALRIVCFGMSPSILAVIPLVGPVIASIFVAIVTIVGTREVYRISTSRAVVVALFPKLLLVGTIMIGLFFAIIALVKIVATAF